MEVLLQEYILLLPRQDRESIKRPFFPMKNFFATFKPRAHIWIITTSGSNGLPVQCLCQMHRVSREPTIDFRFLARCGYSWDTLSVCKL